MKTHSVLIAYSLLGFVVLLCCARWLWVARRMRRHSRPERGHILAREGEGREKLLRGRVDTHTLAIGPSRSGKTSSVITPNVMAWTGGPAVAVSTKQDVLLTAGDAAAARGDVFVLDVLGAVSDDALPPYARRIRWSPLRGCASWSTARARAAAMMGASKRGDVTDAQHWATQGQLMLAPVLHAAASNNVPMRQVMTWLRSLTGLQAALAFLPPGEAREQLDSVLRQDPKPRDSIIATVATAMHAYAGRVLDEASCADDGGWEPYDFLAGANTLFIIAPLDSEVESPAPIVVGVLSELYGAIRVVSDAAGGRLPLPALWVLDEVANISPLPRLPEWLAEAAGRGLTMILGTQDFAQLAERWGRQHAATMWSNLTNKVVFPGIGNPETLAQLEVLAGKHWIEKQSHTRSSGRGHRSASRTVGLHEVPLWPAARVYGLPSGMCLVFRPDFEEPRFARQSRVWELEGFRS